MNLPLLVRVSDPRGHRHFRVVSSADYSRLSDVSFGRCDEDRLHRAAIRGNGPDADLVLSAAEAEGAAEGVSDRSGGTPLTLACAFGSLGVAEVLLAHGASTDTRDASGYTPLFWAGFYGHLDTMALLVSRGADVNAVHERSGLTVLHTTIMGGREDAVEFLLDKGADKLETTTVGSGAGLGPIHLAAAFGLSGVVTSLVFGGVSPDDNAETGASAIHFAIANGHTDAVITLLNLEASVVSLEARRNDSALHTACRYRKADIVEILEERGAPGHCRNGFGETPRDIAVGMMRAIMRNRSA